MIRLKRIVRVPVASGNASDAPAGISSKPRQELEFEVECRGEPDGTTGYLINISDIDAALRSCGAHAILGADAEAGAIALEALRGRLDEALPAPVSALKVRLAHDAWQKVEKGSMNALLGLRYEFAAAHRLHAPSLSDEENRSTFGKCNNPNGHGHNYQLQAEFETPVDGTGASPQELDDLVMRTIIDRFDHKHLNQDLPEFSDLNPSVENIARVIFDRLAPESKKVGAPLKRVTLWETSKTSCTYPAD